MLPCNFQWLFWTTAVEPWATWVLGRGPSVHWKIPARCGSCVSGTISVDATNHGLRSTVVFITETNSCVSRPTRCCSRVNCTSSSVNVLTGRKQFWREKMTGSHWLTAIGWHAKIVILWSCYIIIIARNLTKASLGFALGAWKYNQKQINKKRSYTYSTCKLVFMVNNLN